MSGLPTIIAQQLTPLGIRSRRGLGLLWKAVTHMGEAPDGAWSGRVVLPHKRVCALRPPRLAQEAAWFRVHAGPCHSIKRRNRPVGESTFHKWWVERLDAVGVRYRNPHVTRHTMATRWLRDGGRLETLQEILGHRSSTTTRDLYVHLELRDVLRDLAVIEGRS